MKSSKQTVNVLGLVTCLMCVQINNKQIETKRLALAFARIALEQEIYEMHLTLVGHVMHLKH